jgi:hypothetical protein
MGAFGGRLATRGGEEFVAALREAAEVDACADVPSDAQRVGRKRVSQT